MTELKLQRELLLHQKYEALHALLQASDSLDGKASALLQASSLIVALVGVVAIPQFLTSNPTVYVKLGIAIAFATFLLMVLLSVLAWTPSKMYLPGASDWNQLYQEYLFMSPEESYDQVLSDCIHSISTLQDANSRKSRLITWAAILLVMQILGLFSIALAA